MNKNLIESIRSNYRPRLVDRYLIKLLDAFGGVLIVGPKWCGKSWTALNRAASAVFMDEGDNVNRARLLPESVLEGEVPRLIDEWQDAPRLWDTARRMIDVRREAGQFIFTGSTVPPKHKTSHTGTGRFARLMMQTLSLVESGNSTASVSLAGLFENNGALERPQPSNINFEKALELICRGGWPAGQWDRKVDTGIIAAEYIKSIVENEISQYDGIRRNAALVRLFLRSLARNSATMIKATTMQADIVAATDDTSISLQTIRAYAESLKGLFILREQQPWAPSLRSRKRIRLTPKLHFTDPSLAAAALGATPQILKEDIRTAGFLFESLCYRDLSVYATVNDGNVYHYHDDAELEVDMIVALSDGRWGAIEVKLGTFEFDKAAANLLRLKYKLKKEAPAPSFMAILTASGGVAFTRPDGVTVIPVDCFGP